MLQKYLAEQLEGALIQLKNEINSYTHKEHVWELKGDIKNSTGTLCLHLLGNLNHFIGAAFGNTGYVRQRDKEFSERNVPTSKLMKEIDEVSYMVKNVVSNLTDEQMNAAFPLPLPRPTPNTAAWLIHVLVHLNYHLGQINYHRRLLDQPVSLPDEVERLEKRGI